MKYLILFILLIGSAFGAGPSKSSELRGLWISDPTQLQWKEVMDDFQEAGMNNAFVNFASAGTAFYPSEYLPERKIIDPFENLIREAHERGIKVHGKLLSFFMYWAPPSQIQEMIRQKRVLLNIKGKPHLQAKTPWLDPSQRENRQLVENMVFEILKRYNVDGIQLDYIRFYEEKGVPDSIMEIRRSTLTNFVYDLSLKIKSKYPDVRLSACIFYDYNRARNEMAQDWATWINRRIFTFLTPMNYTINPEALKKWLVRQDRLRQRQCTFYSGLGSYMKGMTPELLKKEIQMIRKSDLPGYVLFSYSNDLKKRMFPMLKEVNGVK